MAAAAADLEGVPPPNIVLIVADDMGFSDLGCFGSEIETPNLDALAAGGARFSQFYAYPRCCPTRASLLTGLYPHQAGVGHMSMPMPEPAYQGHLNENCVTIAEALRASGYRTLMSGKWHVGGAYPAFRPDVWRPGRPGSPTPFTRGFDQHFGTLTGSGSFYDPHTLIRDDTLIQPDSDDFYYTDAISDEAVGMVSGAVADDDPFFLYVAYTAPHWPLHAPAETVAKYRSRYCAGWDAIRTARHEEMKGAGLVDSRWKISPRDDMAPPWEDVAEQDWYDARMATYAAMVDCLDQGIGKIVAELRRQGELDNTLLMFFSDNGGSCEFLMEEGILEMMPSTTRDGRPVRSGNVVGIEPGPADTFMSYGRPWANVSNTPFRKYKSWAHEGGIASSFICHWPGHVVPGAIVHTPAHVIDVMPTCLEAARAAYPAEHNGHRITPVEGVSLLPALQGLDWSPRRDLCWEHEGQWAIRRGDWKLVFGDRGGRSLYNLAEDRTELHDLAEGNDPRVGELLDGYSDWTVRAGVMPWNRVGQLALNTGWAGVQSVIRQDHFEPYTRPRSG